MHWDLDPGKYLNKPEKFSTERVLLGPLTSPSDYRDTKLAGFKTSWFNLVFPAFFIISAKKSEMSGATIYNYNSLRQGKLSS